ncbi:MAG: D-alanyl-D-alanine carboxypeptidase family protein [Anaerotignum sp.]|nr:D-alanyl-D-alanine carboxypeptidase family protein [Anaerotignum sp.]MDY3927308.1 D-alanyl-D-alanine carboxypeptidase family protein [Anaerotignum sp.]
MKKRFLPFLMALSLIFPSFSAFAEEAETVPEENITAETQTSDLALAAETAVLMDAASGEVLYAKNADQKMYPASITKLMTILLALEHGKLTDEITFSHDAVYNIEPGSAHIAIMEGETLTLEQVLRAIILRSANEASNGAAEYVDGSVEAFAKHMTERAKELGCKNTNFVNANGLHDENHYTTAYDMALIAKELLTHEEYRSMMSETYYEIPPTNKQTETRYLHGQHQMMNPNSIYYYEDATGGKTGFTSEALNTLVTYAERDGMELIAVVMKCNGAEHYTDTAALFDYGFENYESVKLLSAADHTTTVKVTETYNDKPVELGTITAAPAEDVYHTLPKGTDTSQIKVETDCPETIEAPVTEGQTVGTLKVSLGGETIKTVDLKAQNAVDAMTDEQKAELDKSSVSCILKKVGIGVVVVILAFLILICITRTIGHYQRKKRRQQRRRRTRRNRRR